ncbi:hypothetical protein GGTG_10065 [Gaeumannomyces tritici R3-111a-1]|uniref:Uncharacterized protein n=1 Tax=Gaeumannomyces tritici (strain R3-111a-1) TaxID=644352 RepID=J3P981_GAET3|nr:hypothetical protein GGTG_10065 [Gaeumannomyces tritici R3-111a-1]EJT73217.1 hypothetical protein GGTG_10065 [Gaeumannomyces tritici R3-111a-1]
MEMDTFIAWPLIILTQVRTVQVHSNAGMGTGWDRSGIKVQMEFVPAQPSAQVCLLVAASCFRVAGVSVLTLAPSF